ncbi:PaaI family thioesterase [Paracoccus sp. MC1854]|uniref:PaaI family thioesterase n=1 Tax=Paracoccus sp. MC1854 TaxID=2760306 RepID=UPI0016023D20|nr:PaaI family thioesterase [Paracoccus sp. MC1854]MBB1490970.1 PaaI family thioesterase [Paracoccus sp. MC1854]
MELLPGTASLDENALARAMIEVIPHASALGMELVEAGPGVVEIAMPWREEFVGDPRTGVLHGGVISALMDTCCGAAVLTHPDRPATTATIDLRIDYLRSATSGQRVRTRAECFHMTRSVAFVRAVAHDEGESPVATATGTFTVGV